jgi:hypothetical protein
VVAPVDDDEILDAPGYEQLAADVNGLFMIEGVERSAAVGL